VCVGCAHTTGMDAHLEVRYWYTLCKVINNGLLEVSD